MGAVLCTSQAVHRRKRYMLRGWVGLEEKGGRIVTSYELYQERFRPVSCWLVGVISSFPTLSPRLPPLQVQTGAKHNATPFTMKWNHRTTEQPYHSTSLVLSSR